MRLRTVLATVAVTTAAILAGAASSTADDGPYIESTGNGPYIGTAMSSTALTSDNGKLSTLTAAGRGGSGMQDHGGYTMEMTEESLRPGSDFAPL
ncbi:hypothetical protein ACWGH2_24560 [Streptomyces sp. NPDC054871]